MSDLTNWIHCPKCGSKKFEKKPESLDCPSCKNSYFNLDGIPWVFRSPAATLERWRGRIRAFSQHVDLQLEKIANNLKSENLLPSTQKRLQHLEKSLKNHQKQVLEILEPLKVEVAQDFDPGEVLLSSLPRTQTVQGYITNIFRDWVWGDEENQRALEITQSLLKGNKGKFLTLGAGVCRLPYDLHQALQPELSVVTDFNPLLFLVAKKLIQDQKDLRLTDFPYAPKDIPTTAIDTKVRPPKKIKGDFHFLFSDAMNPVFNPGSFDVVITPWLIDVIPQNFRDFSKRINTILPIGGIWLNYGTLNFQTNDFETRFGPEEIQEALLEAGFKVEKTRDVEVAYLRREHNRYFRSDLTHTFLATKEKEVKQLPAFEVVPEWVRKTDIPVPASADLEASGVNSRIAADIIGCIDGNRSIKEIAAMVAQVYRVPPAEAEPAVQRFFSDLVDNFRQKRGNFSGAFESTD